MAGKKTKMIYSVLAVLLFLILAGVSLWRMQQGENRASGGSDRGGRDTTYDIVVLGDSIMGRVRDETGIPALLGNALDMTVFNGALGGTCMGRLERSEHANYTKDALSLVSISKSIVSGDFRMQKLVKLKEHGTDYFDETLEQLSGIDFSKVKTLLICYGVNDYHAGEVIDNEQDPYDEYTYIGALRSAVRTLQNAYPDLRIVLATSPYTWYTNEGLTCEEYVLGGNVLEDYVNAELEAAKELGVECIDMYHDFFPHEKWEDWQLYSVDGLHPNEEGRKQLSTLLMYYLKKSPQK